MIDTILNILGWIGTCTSLLGAYLLANKVNPRAGFLLLLAADMLLSINLVRGGIWNQVVLLLIFAVMNIVGFFRYKEVQA